jgi:large subunit ribosomal protein L1
MRKQGKRFRTLASAYDRSRLYDPQEATQIVKRNANAKFDETVEIHIKLGVDPKKSDQNVRGTVNLPHGTGRTVRVIAFAKGDAAKAAEAAGADVVGEADLIERVKGGFTEFDVAVATPDQMGVVGRLGRILGPRGLMPNPKTGTVTMEVGKAVRDAKAGKLEYRTDRGANVHVAIGKKSFEERQLVENYAALLDEIVRAKPAAAKGRYLRTITLATTMGPGIRVDPTRTRDITGDSAEAEAALA